MWKVAWTMWKAKPILGVSVSGWQDAYRETVDSVLPYVSPDGIVIRSPEAMHAHSLFFQVLSSTGILGSLCFCWLFICIVRILSKNVADWRWGLTPWPAIFLVIGLTGWNIFGSQYLPLFAYYMTLTGISMPPVSPAESR
jgi:O-antigen ligase